MSSLVGQTQTIGFGLSFRPFVLVFLLPGEIICEPGLWLIFPRQYFSDSVRRTKHLEIESYLVSCELPTDLDTGSTGFKLQL